MSAKKESLVRHDYVSRLMTALEFATEHHWKLAVCEGRLVVQADEQYHLTHSWSEEGLSALVDLEIEVDRQKEGERREALTRELRISARGKLTDDEAAAVGLNFPNTVAR